MRSRLRLICLGFGLMSLFVLTATPFYFYFLPMNSSNSVSGCGNFSEGVIANATVCPKPLIRTRTNCTQYIRVYCSPPCNQPTWKIGATIFNISLYVSVVIYWSCIVVAFVTWAQGKKLLSYQSLIILFSTASLVVYSISITMTVFLGQKRIYCKHDSMIDSWIDPTTACHVQGLVLDFGSLSFMMWWLCSVSSTVLTVWNPAKIDYIRQKCLFCIQIALSLIVPGGQLAFNLLRGVEYAKTLPYAPYCSQSSYFWFFWTYVLPADIIIICGTVMSVVVAVKLHKIKKTYRRDASVNQIAEACALVEKRFFLLSIVLPLTVASQMTTDIIYDKKTIQTIAECLGSTNQTAINSCISDYEENPGWFASAMINLVLPALTFVAFVTYCLIPKPGRRFWSQVWDKCKKRQFRRRLQADVTEVRESEATCLFPSSTQRELDSFNK